MKNSTIIHIATLVLIALPGVIFCTGVTPPPTPVPLDPVSGTLLLGGGAYLGKKVYDKYKQQ